MIGKLRMGKFWILLLIPLAMLLFSACGAENPPSVVSPTTTQVTYDLSLVITVGNHSWIPIHKYGNPGNDPSFILHILKAFEDAHPELEVVPGGWKIEKQQQTGGYANSVSATIFGIWVDHKLKDR